MNSNNTKHVATCPVDNGTETSQPPSWNPLQWFSARAAGSFTSAVAATTANAADCPVKHQSPASGSSGGCPVKHDGKLPASIEEAANHAQTPRPDQRFPLSTHRQVSSIPRADDMAEAAAHQPKSGENNWVYPSQQQIYNAMRRKGYDVEESTIPMVIQIHNSVNERSWNSVKRWERELHGVEEPRLVTILGRPDRLSPKAMFQTYVLQKEPPFDRHDWCVDRGDGVSRRYVIDFYGKDAPSGDDGLPSMTLDVRPALDSPGAAVDRMHMALRDVFPSIFAVAGGKRFDSTAPLSSSTPSQGASKPDS
jgi:cytochrome c heme-lyase